MSTFMSSSFGAAAGQTKIYLPEDSQASEFATLDLRRVREENVKLREDLAQCQVDKEFVWSLWKKLQVASPDVTEAVALVVEREKQKTEEKDRKVLDILKLKDDKLQELQRALETQSQELAFTNHKKLELHDEVAHHQTDKAKVIEELTELKQHIDEEKSQHQQSNNSLMSTIAELTETCEKLQDELSKSSVEVDKITKRLHKAEDENGALQHHNKALQDRLDSLSDKEGKLTNLAKKYESQLRKITVELKSKNKELDSSRRELSDLWATHHQCESNAQQREAIIRQLEDLQQNTEKMLRECEGAHTKQNDQQYQMNLKLHNELSYLRERELDQQERIQALEQALEVLEGQSDVRHLEREDCEPIIDTEAIVEEKWKNRLLGVERENEKLREKLHDKNRVIDRLSKSTDFHYINADKDEQSQPRSAGKHSRSKSESGLSIKEQEMGKRYKVAEAKLEQCEIRLQLKESQLDALKQAHERRLCRLRNLLTSYKLVREQLKVAEDELGRPPKKRKPKFKRPSKKQLQQEDNEAAWNELRYIKNENKNLHIIKMNMEEQLDDMAVKASEDAANVHMLEIQVNTLEEELKYIRRPGKNISSTPRKQAQEDISQLHAKLVSCQSVISSQQTRLKEISRDNTVLVEEKRTLKFEINSLKKCLYDKKSELADLQSVISRLRRVSKRNRPPIARPRVTYESPIAQRYEDVLQNSLDSMNAAMDKEAVTSEPCLSGEQALPEPVNGWVSEPEDDFGSETMSELGSVDIPEPTNSVASLGGVIAQRAVRMGSEDTSCQTSPGLLRLLMRSLHDRAERPARRLTTARPVRERNNSKQLRDVGTSTVPWKLRAIKRAAKTTAFTQVSSLKQRLISLQMKVKVLTEAKDQTKEKADELVVSCEQLQNQINTTNSQLTHQRITIQRLESDLTNANVKIADYESTIERSVPRQQADQDRKTLEQKLKVATQDLARRNTELKQAKSELETSKESNIDLVNRAGRLERDVAQKRILLEDLRLKLRLAKETAQGDLEMLESKSEEVERIKSITDQNKTTMDSMKSSIKALTKDKKDYERKYKESQQELSKKEKQLAACQAQTQTLQHEIDSLQETARQQLVNLAAQGENAVGVAQAQLFNAHELIEQFQLLIKRLSDALLARQETYRVERQRQVREEKLKTKKAANKKVESDALNQAKKKAQEILNLSAADIDDLLNSNSEDEEEESFSSYWKRENTRWVRKWEKALTTENFVKKVTDLFIAKIDELHGLAR